PCARDSPAKATSPRRSAGWQAPPPKHSGQRGNLKKLRLSHLLRPHRAVLAVAFIAVLGEAVTALLEPWPLKIVFDYVFGAKHMPAWMSGLIGSTFGLDKISILHFAVLAVIVIAVAGALSAYAEKY